GSTVSSPTNGQNHTWKVRALNAGGPGAASGASNATSAYGPIADASNLTASSAGPKVTFSWNTNWQQYGNGRQITGSSVTVNGQAVNAGAGSWTSPEEANKSYTITVTVSRADGSRSFSRTQVVPPAQITAIYRGDRVNVDGTSGWHYVIVEYRNFPQGTRDVWCRANGTNLDPNYGRAPIGFAHSGRVQTKCIAKIESPEPGAITMSVEGMGDFQFSNWSG
ncbi:MAG TPA: hypothetical protein VHH13_10565, partial [Arthrobacter sp.]|nr:hypothetical protein [Arthrobacter sp.]